MHRNRYSYFDEGALPTYNSSSYIIYFMIRTSILLVFMFLVLMPKISSSTATKYETAYACEGKTLTLECEPGDLISLIRANYGRFSITICNDHGNVEWSVNCRSSKSLRVLNLKCAHKQNCSVLASTNMFGDPCPGTHKYLEAHYKCISATLTLTTTTRPSPSWLITQQPPPSVHNSWTTTTTAITTSSSLSSSSSAYNKFLGNGTTNNSKSVVSVVGVSSSIPKLPSGGGNSEIHLAGRPPSGVHRGYQPSIGDLGKNNANKDPTVTTTIKSTTAINKQVNYNMDVNHILGNHSYDINNNSFNSNNNLNNENFHKNISTQSTELVNDNSNNNSNVKQKNYDNSDDTNIGSINSNSYCGPTTSRNLFWNRTRVGDVNVQQCPDGTNGIAKWRCIVMPRSVLNHNSRYDLNSFINRNSFINKKFNYINNHEYNGNDSGSSNNNNSKDNGDLINNDCDSNNNNNKNNNGNCDKIKTIKLVNGINNNKNNNNGNISINSINNDKDYLPIWHPQTPDLTQCRSVWFSNLENDVNKRDSSLVSIANDLSTLTSSQVLYGGDMLVTTKIIQTMSEKMPDDIETFPDQRQREAIISELLTGVVKIGSNLLDKSQQPSWLDLSHEDQMRVATSLLTGLESNAFLLADSITREKTATYPTKNILLSVRVLDSKNLPMNEIFPNDKNAENWDISHDRIELPRGALYENSDGGLVRIIFVAFDRLESILRPSYENLDFKIPRNNVQKSTSSETQNLVHRVQILNSKVISASLGKGRHIQLSQPIKLVLKHLKTENVTNPTCVFWNYIDHAWSSDGCYLESTNRTHSICMCNHLTNFAILMDVKEEHNKSLLSIFDNNLGIFIYISITICIIFIIIAILTLKLFNGAFIKSTRTSIYKNIYVCLFIIEILSLVGVKQNETSLLCGFTTAFLHCFILSAIAWLFFEGFQLYVTLTTEDIVLEVESSSKIIWYYLLSYGLSFTIVAISLAIDPGTYTQSDFCVLMEANALFYSTFMTPIAIFVVGTLVCTGLACYDMCRKNRSQIKNKEHTRLSTVRFDLRCSLLFLLILSADWVFAYLYLRRAKQEELIAFTYGYLFVIFNSILGVYIFIFHCIQNEKIRREYRKYVRQNSWLPKCLRCSKTSSITSSASQNHHPPHHHLSQSQLQQQQISNQTSTHHYETSSISGNQKNPIIIANNNLESGGCNNKESIITPGIITNAGTPIIRKYLSIDGYPSEVIDCSQITIGGGGGAITPGIGTVQRNSSGGIKTGNTIIRTPSGGHASPTSSIGSAHLIYDSKHLQQQHLQQQQQQQQQQKQQSNECWNYSLRQQNTMSENNKNLNTYDDKFLFYDCKSKRLKNHHPTATTPRNLSHQSKRNPSSVICNSTGIPGDMTNISGLTNHENFPYQQHEYFYWTEKNHGNGQSNIRKQINNNGETNKGHNFYPSYKKTRQYSQQYYPTTGSGRVYNKLSDCEFQLENDSNCPSSNLHEDSNLGNSFSNNSGGPNSIGANKYYEPSGAFNRYPNSASHSSSKNQLSSDEDQCGNDSVSSHHQLMQHNNIGGSGNNSNVGGGSTNGSGNAGVGSINTSGVGPSIVSSIGNKFQSNSIVMGICGPSIITSSGISGTPYHRHPHYDNKHSNCDLVNDFENSPKNTTIGVTGNTGLEVYYNHHSGTALDEPVYEEILNSRASERMSDRNDEEDRDVNDDEEDDDEDEDNDNDDDEDDDDEDDDDDDDDDDRLVPKNIKQQQMCGSRITSFTSNLSGMSENEEDCIMNEQQYNRLRRIIANKENEERGRFRRQDFKSNNSNESGILPGNLFTYINKRPSPLSMSVLEDTITDNAIIDSQKQQQLQSQLNKQLKQQQKQIQSPSEQQIVGRNISAMLDDNNTVRCYLEPLQK